MTLPKYAKYKESKAAWLGEVPTHWAVARLKSRAALITEKAVQRTRPVALENIEGWSGRFITSKGEFQGEGVSFLAGDILFGKLRPYLAKVYLADSPGEAVGDFHVLRPASAMCARYLQYQILNRAFIDVVDGATFGSKMPRASWESLGNMTIAIPPLSEQTAIAAFLDRETAKIDGLIAEQETLTALLTEKRQATISHAVTKGLDPNAAIKESNVEWIGEVPAHWEVRRMKTVSPEITVGIVVEPSKYYVDTGVPALRSLNVLPGRITTENMVYISEKSNDALAKSRLQAGDLVSVRSGQTGVTAVVPDELDGCNCIDLIILRKPLVDCARFLCWYFASDSALKQFAAGSGGAIQQHFNIGMAMNLHVPLPSVQEQHAIADFLDSETSKLDVLFAQVERGGVLLKERRLALIAAAVTGKIDVRSVVPQAAAECPEAIAA